MLWMSLSLSWKVQHSWAGTCRNPMQARYPRRNAGNHGFLQKLVCATELVAVVSLQWHMCGSCKAFSLCRWHGKWFTKCLPVLTGTTWSREMAQRRLRLSWPDSQLCVNHYEHSCCHIFKATACHIITTQAGHEQVSPTRALQMKLEYRSIQIDYRKTLLLRGINFQLQIQNRAARRIKFPLQRQIIVIFCRKSLITDTDYLLSSN